MITISSTSLTRASRNRHLLIRVFRSKLPKEELEVDKKDDQKKVKTSRKFLSELIIVRTLVALVFLELLALVRSGWASCVTAESLAVADGGGSCAAKRLRLR